MTNRLIRLAAITIAFGLLAVAPASGAAGSELGNQTEAGAVEVQPNGRIIVAGTTRECDQAEFVFCSVDPASLFVARFTASGELDRKFGGGDGVAVFSVPDGAVKLVGLALLGDGRIVAATESAFGRRLTGALSLVRLQPDGTLDAGFGQAGVALISHDRFYGGSNNALAVDANGNILVAGSGPGDPGDAGDQFAVARLVAGGGLDTGFGNSGIASLRVDPAAEAERAEAIVVRSDGRIVLAGGSGPVQPGSTPEQGGFAAAQLLPSGSPDSSFGGDGRTVVASVTAEELMVGARALSLRPGGGLLLTGSRDVGNRGCADVTVAALTEAGESDPSYGQGGLAELHTPGCFGGSDAVLSTSNELLATAVGPNGTGATLGYTPQLQLGRFGPSGAIDTTYGQNGIASPSIFGLQSNLVGLAATSSQPVLGAGWAQSESCRRGKQGRSARCVAMLLAKLDANGQLEEGFGDNGFVTVPAVCRGQRRDACALSRQRFKRLIRKGLPRFARASRKLSLRFRCEKAIGEKCQVRLRAATSRSGGLLGRAPKKRIRPGRRRNLHIRLSALEARSLHSVKRLSLTITAKTPNQKKVRVRKSISLRHK